MPGASEPRASLGQLSTLVGVGVYPEIVVECRDTRVVAGKHADGPVGGIEAQMDQGCHSRTLNKGGQADIPASARPRS